MDSLGLFMDLIFPAALWPWGHSASNRNEYQGYLQGGKGSQYEGLTSLPPSCANCLEIMGFPRACPGL